MSDLAISVVNFKSRELIRECLQSIYNKKWKVKVEVWVVDNASGDDSGEFLKKLFPQIKFIQNQKNIGFSAAHNMVLKQVKPRYALVLNPDTQVLAGALDKMVEFMDKHAAVGVASCKVLNFDGSLQPNGGDLPLGLAVLTWLFNLESLGIHKPSYHRVDADYYEKVNEVGWVSGNFMIIRREVFEKVGFLNESYFMYFEDVEFCYRVKREGFKVMINPEVAIKHLSGGSSSDPKFRQWVGEYKGLIIFYFSLFGILGGMVIRLLIYLSTILRILAFALVGKLDYAKTYGKVLISI